MTTEERIAALEKRIQEQEDIQDIIRLARAYATTADGGWAAHNNGKTHNGELFSELFAEDGVWDASDFCGRFEGKEAIKNAINGFQIMPKQMHYLCNPDIRINPDGVTATGDWHVCTPGTHPDGSNKLCFAYYHNTYVKDPVKGWLFKEVKIESAYSGNLGEIPFKWEGLASDAIVVDA